MTQLLTRPAQPRAAHTLEQLGVSPLLARLLATRGVHSAQALDASLAQLLAPQTLRGVDTAAALLAQARARGWRLAVVADYDCDGATACAVALRGMARLGFAPAQLHIVVPDRAVHGYGLTPAIVDLALAEHGPLELLITVDNGIASHAGVAHAKALGLAVLVTDHHLPAADLPLPEADAIVNPNQPGCAFASKALAGVGVMFYVLLALRARLREAGAFTAQPRLDDLLPLVALGTVADVVPLDDNNRRLVAQGLARIRAGHQPAGMAALFAVAGRKPERASAQDFGFALGPRLNAAGRLADMRLGIACLLTDDPAEAKELAGRLDAINRERRQVEAGMKAEAESQVAALRLSATPPPALVLFDPGFHEGVVGIVAGRVKEQAHRPTFVFARGEGGVLKGSGRSIAGFHLRDALDLVAKRQPGVLKKFGGHAMAAGCTLTEADLPAFTAAFSAVAAERLSPDVLARRLLTDGPLDPEHWTPATVAELDAQVWGNGFEAPLFCDEVDVLNQRLVGEKHLKLRVRHAGALRDAIWFGRTEPLPERVRLAYRVSLDEYQGQQRLQMVVEAAA